MSYKLQEASYKMQDNLETGNLKLATGLPVAGLTKFTTIDYPGHLACVIYTQGCPLRCSYCHNPEMQKVYSPSPCPSPTSLTLSSDDESEAPLPSPLREREGPAKREGEGHSWPSILSFLSKRAGTLDAVVFSGGEPLLQKHLYEAVQTVRGMGFKVALHTSGVYPDRFAKVLPLLDWVGFDVKTVFDDYESVTFAPGSGKRAFKSLELLLQSGVDYEVRTTADPDIIDPVTLLRLARNLRARGVTCYRLQESSLMEKEYSPNIENRIAALFDDFEIRRQTQETRKTGTE